MMRIVLLIATICLLPMLPAQTQTRIMPGTPAPKPPEEQKRIAPGTPAPKDEGQKPGALKPDEGDFVIPMQVQVVLVPTTVTDKKGNTVNGLKPQDFVLLDNDKAQQISRDVTFLPLSMVVCIQRSSNVDMVLPKIKQMGNVMHDLLIGQDGEAAIIGFDHRVEVLQGFTNDAEKINAAVEKLKPGSRTSRLNDSIQEAARMLRSKKDRRKTILLVSETMDRSSEAKVKEVATELQLYNIDVFTLNISRIITRFGEKPGIPRPDPFPPGARPSPGIASNDPTTQSQMYGTPGYSVDFVPVIQEIFTATKAIFIKNPAEVYTQFTGGREYSFMSQKDLETAIAAIGSEIRAQYILSYSPNNKVEGGFHKIQVTVNRPGLKVRTRPGYWMAGVPN